MNVRLREHGLEETFSMTESLVGEAKQPFEFWLSQQLALWDCKLRIFANASSQLSFDC
jgi:hypothetical protein